MKKTKPVTDILVPNSTVSCLNLSAAGRPSKTHTG